MAQNRLPQFEALTQYFHGKRAEPAETKQIPTYQPKKQFLCKTAQGRSPSQSEAIILLPPASQILSNEEKRANFDRYGDAGESQGYSQHQQRQFHHFHEGFYFDESFFHFPFNSERRDTSDEKYLLHFSHYINEIVPDSFKKPYLIKITSDWCFSCIHIEPVWKEVAQELEVLGKDEAGPTPSGLV